MFGRLKPIFGRSKPEVEEEDSLVPHGLVWQAMTEPERPGDGGDGDPARAIGPTVPPIPPPGPSPDPPLPAPLLPKQAASKPAAVPISAAAHVSIPAPPSVSAPSVSAPNIPAPQLFWRSVKREQATDRLSAEDQTTHAAQSTARSIRESVAIRSKGLNGIAQSIRESVASKSKALTGIAEKALDRSQQYVKETQPLFLRTHRQLTRGSKLSAAWVAQTRLRTRDFVAARASEAMIQLRTQTQNLRIDTAKLFDWVLTLAKRQPRPVQLPLLDLQPANREGWKTLTREARIFLTALPVRTRLMVLRTMAEMRMPSPAERIQSSSSIRTLAAVASVALVLVAGLVSATRHYAAVSLPSHFLDITSASASAGNETGPSADLSQSTAAQNTSGPSPSSPSSSGATAAQVTTNTTEVTEPKEVAKPSHVQPKRPAAEHTVRPKRHRTEDDDYVARDTYVYYGNRPNSSR